MSNIQNEEIKENIKEELEEMPMNDFSNNDWNSVNEILSSSSNIFSFSSSFC